MAEDLDRIAHDKTDRFGVKITLKERVQTRLRDCARHPGLLLYLLLSLSTPSIVTQNYDQLIEVAMSCRDVSVPIMRRETLSVIPYKPKRGASRWLLKMHGCVSKPGDIGSNPTGL
jgi:hypothetical protein